MEIIFVLYEETNGMRYSSINLFQLYKYYILFYLQTEKKSS